MNSDDENASVPMANQTTEWCDVGRWGEGAGRARRKERTALDTLHALRFVLCCVVLCCVVWGPVPLLPLLRCLHSLPPSLHASQVSRSSGTAGCAEEGGPPDPTRRRAQEKETGMGIMGSGRAIHL